MADINKVKKINGKDIVVNWDNIDNKPDDLANLPNIGDINSALEEIITLQEELLIPDGNEVAY